jgi:hypothetical protein
MKKLFVLLTVALLTWMNVAQADTITQDMAVPGAYSLTINATGAGGLSFKADEIISYKSCTGYRCHGSWMRTSFQPEATLKDAAGNVLYTFPQIVTCLSPGGYAGSCLGGNYQHNIADAIAALPMGSYTLTINAMPISTGAYAGQVHYTLSVTQ